MSSIISDIFYNPKNNNLIDNYLINRQPQFTDSSISNIIDGGSWQSDGSININLDLTVEKAKS